MNIIHTEREVLVAACDMELLGKDFREGIAHLSVPESFYGGMEVEEDDLPSILEGATIANLTGERTVSKAVETGFISEGNILRVEGVPHAQFVVHFTR
ncbi:MAG: DUF424 domain-containing protein [Thermoplasmata archaeon]|nr:DUF424 domain-containing protein [Thermoplasmata archaeon]